VTDEFKMDWLTYLTSSENVIFAQVDGRGSGGRGVAFLHKIYRRFGTIEVQDQLTAARYITCVNVPVLTAPPAEAVVVVTSDA